MTLRSALHPSLVLIAVAALAACDQGRQAPPKTNVQIVHAAPAAPTLDFRREQERSVSVSQLDYGNASVVLVYDEDTYDFHVETLPPGADTLTRVPFTQTVASGTDYKFVLTEVGGALTPVILELPQLQADAATHQVVAVHAAPATGTVDMFVEPASADLTTATPLGQLSFTQSVAPAARPAGEEYVVTLTEPGNPVNVRFQSNPVVLPGGLRTLFVIIDAAGLGTDTLRVLLVRDTSAPLIDRNAAPAIRVVNAAADGAPRDVAVGEDLAAPLFVAVPAGQASAYTPVPTGEITLTVLPAGNPGVTETTLKVTAGPGSAYTVIVAGQPGELKAISLLDNRRLVSDRARLTLLNGATQFSKVSFYLLEPGGNPDETVPAATIEAPAGAQYFELAAGTYDVVLRNDQNVTIAGPMSITVANGGLCALLATNGPDAATATLVPIEGL